jgi:hypothetical protein
VVGLFSRAGLWKYGGFCGSMRTLDGVLICEGWPGWPWRSSSVPSKAILVRALSNHRPPANAETPSIFLIHIKATALQ